jgi:hypothetical protein
MAGLWAAHGWARIDRRQSADRARAATAAPRANAREAKGAEATARRVRGHGRLWTEKTE